MSVPKRFLPLSQFFLQQDKPIDGQKVMYGRQEPAKKKASKDTKKQPASTDDPRGPREEHILWMIEGGPKSGPWDKPHKCKYCGSPATRDLIWAEGRAYIPVCDGHRKRGEHRILVKNRDSIAAAKPVVQEAKVNFALDESAAHAKSIALMRWLSKVAKELRVERDVYVVGGAVRNFVIDQPIKDVDVVFDAVAVGRGRNSEWFAKQLRKKMPAKSSLATNQYGVAIITVKGDWDIEGSNLKGEVIEIANARSESYGGGEGKGYKPSEIKPASIEKDIKRREFTFNTLMWRLADLASGPDKAEIVDLTGCGLADLKAGTMRCPASPDKTFSDDPTRMLRAIKFTIKYGFKISKDTEASIRRNADKIRNAPSSAIAKLLIDPILKEPRTAPKALREMKRLGLLDVVAKMVRTDRQFASTLTNWANDQRVGLLFDLMDLGLPLKTKLGAFTSDQQKRIREVTATMPDTKARDFLAALKQPGRAWKDKLFFVMLSTEMDAEKGRAMGDLARRVNRVAQDVMLANPELADDPQKLKVAIRQGLSAQEGTTTTANVPTVAVPIGAGDGRKFLDRPGKKKKKDKKDLSTRMGLLLRQLF